MTAAGFDRDALVAHGRELFARFTDATDFSVLFSSSSQGES